MNDHVDAIVAALGMTHADLVGPERDQPRCDLRQVVCLILTRMGHRSKEVATVTQRTASNVRHARRRAAFLEQVDAGFQRKLALAQEKLQ